ncbi:MAG: ABC transporter permease [Chthonomonadales bacterium]
MSSGGPLNTDARGSLLGKLGAIRELPAAAMLALVVAWIAGTRASFHTYANLAQVGQEGALIGIMACGEALVILTGGIDLSVGAILALSACAAGSLMMAGWPVAAAGAVGLAAGAACGWINGALITYRRLPPILSTLSTLLIYRAVTNIETRAEPFNQLPQSFRMLGGGFVPFGVFVAVVAVFAAVLARMRFGRRVVAIGGSDEAVRLSGVPVDAVLRRVYMLSGLCAAISGLIMSAAANNAQWNLAEGWELEVIAAVVIGGVRLTGGMGSVIGAALGALIIVVLRNALFLSGVPTERYGLVTGGVILAAAMGEQIRRMRREALA